MVYQPSGLTDANPARERDSGVRGGERQVRAYLRSMPFALSTGVAFDPVTQATSALAACLSETAVLAAAENLISDWNSPGSGPRMSTPLIGRISLKSVITNPALPSATLCVAGPEPGARMIFDLTSAAIPRRSNIFSM